ncbi:MAG: hypothetical protein AM1032_000138 [Mycoplasmataceae bacterium]|nr:MAG: hypothetical protein AM1032_000138 [Mycoplasmataceae bacterium]
MTDKGIIGRNFHLIIDTVDSLKVSKIYTKNSPFCGETIWILQCKKNKIQVLDYHLEDKNFLKTLEENDVLGKKFKFTISQRGKYVIKAEEVI